MLNLSFDDEFNEKLLKRMEELSKSIKESLKRPEQSGIDIDLFWVQLCREYEEILEKNPEEIKEMNTEERKNLEIFRKNFINQQPVIREVYLPDANKYDCYSFLTKGQEKTYRKNTMENSNKLLKVLKNVSGKEELSAEEGVETLKEVLRGITLVDFATIYTNPYFTEMQYITIFKNYLLKNGYTSDQLEQLSIDEIRDNALSTYNFETIESHSEIVANTVLSSLHEIDLDKLFLISMLRPLMSYEAMQSKKESSKPETLEEMSEDEDKEGFKGYIKEKYDLNGFIEETQKTESIIKRILETGVVSKRIKFKMIKDDEYEEVSFKTLTKLMENYCEGIYLSNTIKQCIKNNACFADAELSNWSDEILKRLDFKEEEINTLSLVNFENLKKLYEIDVIDKEKIKRFLVESSYQTEPVVIEEGKVGALNQVIEYNLRYLLSNLVREGNILSKEDYKEYFSDGTITPEMIYRLEESRDEEELKKVYDDFKEFFEPELLLDIYRQYEEKFVEFIKLQKEQPEETEKIEELRELINHMRGQKDNYRELFCKLNSDLSEEEKNKLGNEMLEKYYVEMDITDEDILQETIKTLYEDGLINLENIIGVDKNYLIPMLDTLSLEDTSKVRESMSFKQVEELLDDIFSNKEFSDERKFIIVMNLLGEDTEEDKQAREFYLSLLEFDNNSERKAKPTGKKRSIINPTVESKKYIYPDFVKWKFYKGLDKDVRVTRYANGFVEFASSKLGVRIIEKYYDGDKPAYGTATYILPEQEYRKNQSNLITITPKGNILESATLREITPRKDRIAHRTHSTDRTWMDEIVKYFDISYERENDTRYTEEELKALQKTVEKYKTEYDEIII